MKEKEFVGSHVMLDLHITAPSCSITFTDRIKIPPGIFKIDLLSVNAENGCCFAQQVFDDP